MLKYLGTRWDLKELTWGSGVRGFWTKYSSQICRFEWRGAVLHFWPGTSTVQFQGPSWAAMQLKKRLFDYALNNDLEVFIETHSKKRNAKRCHEHGESALASTPRRPALPSDVIDGGWDEVLEDDTDSED